MTNFSVLFRAFNPNGTLKPVCELEHRVSATSPNEIIRKFEKEFKYWKRRYNSVPRVSINIYDNNGSLAPLEQRYFRSPIKSNL